MKIVLISITNKDNQNSGDFISEHDDKTDLSGSGYNDFTVVKIPSLKIGEYDFSGCNFSKVTIADIDLLYKADKEKAVELLDSLKT